MDGDYDSQLTAHSTFKAQKSHSSCSRIMHVRESHDHAIIRSEAALILTINVGSSFGHAKRKCRARENMA